MARGQQFKLYYNTGTYGSPTWTQIPLVRDLDLNMVREAIEATTRGAGTMQYEPGIVDPELVFEMRLLVTDSTYLALRTMFDSETADDFAIATGPIASTGTNYFRCDFIVTEFSHPQPLNGLCTVRVTLKPAVSSNTAGWTVVS